MAVENVFSGKCRTAVVDAFSLYRIALGHTSGGAALRSMARKGRIRLVVPAVSFAVACSMRTCWDEDCALGHGEGTGGPIRDFAEGGGAEVLDPTPAGMVSAGRLYARCMDHRVTGAEVLAACHSALTADSLDTPLLSAPRAFYCYATGLEPDVRPRLQLI